MARPSIQSGFRIAIASAVAFTIRSCEIKVTIRVTNAYINRASPPANAVIFTRSRSTSFDRTQ